MEPITFGASYVGHTLRGALIISEFVCNSKAFCDIVHPKFISQNADVQLLMAPNSIGAQPGDIVDVQTIGAVYHDGRAKILANIYKK